MMDYRYPESIKTKTENAVKLCGYTFMSGFDGAACKVDYKVTEWW